MSKFVRSTAINEARLIEVLQVKSIIGDGTHESPVVEITEYYSKDGELLARRGLEGLYRGIWQGNRSEG